MDLQADFGAIASRLIGRFVRGWRLEAATAREMIMIFLLPSLRVVKRKLRITNYSVASMLVEKATVASY